MSAPYGDMEIRKMGHVLERASQSCSKCIGDGCQRRYSLSEMAIDASNRGKAKCEISSVARSPGARSNPFQSSAEFQIYHFSLKSGILTCSTQVKAGNRI